jgi:arylsulfatase
MELDANVGKVMDAIRSAAIEKNTIVVFSSDNGPWVDAWPDAGYGPFRGMKGTGFENGWRVPGLMWAPGRIQAGTVLHGMMSHMDIWPTTAAMGLKPPPHGEWVGNDGKPVYFDGHHNSAYVTGRLKHTDVSGNRYRHVGTGHTSMGCRSWESGMISGSFFFTAKDSWLGPELKLTGISSRYNLQMDPGEQYDMIFNGVAPRDAGVSTTSPGRYAGADNGWAVALSTYVINVVNESFNKYPNIPTVLAGASLGADLPEFTLLNLVAPPEATSAGTSAGGTQASRAQ